MRNQAFRRDAQLLVQSPDHWQGQRPFAGQYFINPIPASDHRLLIGI
jgi:hypothetical protein